MFRKDDEIKEAFNARFVSHELCFYNEMIQRLLLRYKYLNNGENYVEKQCEDVHVK